MQVKVNQSGMHLPQDVLDLLDHRLEAAFDRFESHIHRVEVHLSDVNGPKGGIDKRCRMIINLDGGQVVPIEDMDDHWESLFSRIADRAREAVSRRMPRSPKGNVSFSGE